MAFLHIPQGSWSGNPDCRNLSCDLAAGHRAQPGLPRSRSLGIVSSTGGQIVGTAADFLKGRNSAAPGVPLANNCTAL